MKPDTPQTIYLKDYTAPYIFKIKIYIILLYF